MKKLILTISALTCMVCAEAQLLSSNGGGAVSFSGISSSSNLNGIESGKLSTDASQNEIFTYESATDEKSQIFSFITKRNGSNKSSFVSSSITQKKHKERIDFCRSRFYYVADIDYRGNDHSGNFDAGYSRLSSLYNGLLLLDYGIAYTATSEYVYFDSTDILYETRSIKVPLSLLLNLRISHNFNLRPYCGVNLKYNFDQHYSHRNGYSYKDFQLGSQYGIELSFSHIFVRFGSDRDLTYAFTSPNGAYESKDSLVLTFGLAF